MTVRPVFVVLHRWVGLAIAAFVFLAGVTGAVISWDHELDDWLNPHLTRAVTAGPARPALDLAREIEIRDPRVRVGYLPLAAEPGETLSVTVSPRVDPATGRLFALGFNQIFLDPASGAEVGRREWGAVWPITRETAVSFLYRLHYTLHVPSIWGEDRWGFWLMGAVALLWTIDTFVGFYLTLPPRKAARAGRPPIVQRELARGFWARWRPAWRIKTGGSAYRITFDIHRAASLWTWGLLLILAFTAFSMNLSREIFMPVMSLISTVTPDPYTQRPMAPLDRPIDPALGFADVLAAGRAEADRRGWTTPVGALSYEDRFGIYSVRFFAPGDENGAGGVGPAKLFFDGADGRLLGESQPWVGTAADLFVQAQFPLHSGRILGLPGRILISLMGLVSAALSVTGLIIWWRKRAARVLSRRRDRGGVPAPAVPAE